MVMDDLLTSNIRSSVLSRYEIFRDNYGEATHHEILVLISSISSCLSFAHKWSCPLVWSYARICHH
jgi:hypothetical protein